jgi:hypothetical protein
MGSEAVLCTVYHSLKGLGLFWKQELSMLVSTANLILISVSFTLKGYVDHILGSTKESERASPLVLADPEKSAASSVRCAQSSGCDSR